MGEGVFNLHTLKDLSSGKMQGSNVPVGRWPGAEAPDGNTFAMLEELQRRQRGWRRVNKAESPR